MKTKTKTRTKMQTRRSLAMLLSAVMLLSTVGCSTDNGAKPTVLETASETAAEAAPETGSAPAADSQGKDGAPYMELPEQYRSWKNGEDVNYEKSAIAKNGMVAALRYEPASIGSKIMEEGGTAIDAAVATAVALTVTMPHMCSLAGGGLMTFYSAETDEVVYISFREVAPQFQTAEMWVQDGEGNVIGDHNNYGGLSVGVPGEVAGLYYALNKYGTMEWADVLQPAIDLARGGYTVTPELREAIVYGFEDISRIPEAADIYLNEYGIAPEAGTIIRNEPLARALEIVQEKGRDGFYQGMIAEAVVKTAQRSGGVITMDDLAAYDCWEEEPAKGDYRGYTIYSSASPSSGGSFIIETLNIMENLPVYDFDSVEHWHQLIEVQKMVWADRGEYMGDTRFIDVPLKGIMNKTYAAGLAGKIDMEKSQDFTYGNPWNYESESQNTTSFCVADAAGNMVALTHTINGFWGSHDYVDGYGFFLNNELGDFVVGSGYSNSVEPGKAPLSSMSPTVIFDPDGKPFMTCGAPGGFLIYPCIAQVIMNVIDYGMDVDEALNTARVAATGPLTLICPEVTQEMQDQLTALGHEQYGTYNAIGFPTAIMYLPDGTLKGSAEDDGSNATYSDGVAIGY